MNTLTILIGIGFGLVGGFLLDICGRLEQIRYELHQMNERAKNDRL